MSSVEEEIALAEFWRTPMPFEAYFLRSPVWVLGRYLPGSPEDGGVPNQPTKHEPVRIRYRSGARAGETAAVLPSSLRARDGARLFPALVALHLPRRNPSRTPKGCQPLRERRQEARAAGLAFDPFIGAAVPRRAGRGRPAAYLTPETRELAQRMAQVEHLIGEIVWKYGMSEEAVKCLRSDLMGIANLLNEARGRRSELADLGRWPPNEKTYTPPRKRGRPKKRKR